MYMTSSVRRRMIDPSDSNGTIFGTSCFGQCLASLVKFSQKLSALTGQNRRLALQTLNVLTRQALTNCIDSASHLLIAIVIKHAYTKWLERLNNFFSQHSQCLWLFARNQHTLSLS